jgi:hypothetical protein
LRIRESLRNQEEAKERNIEKMLYQTALMDSPIKAANLEGMLRQQWCEKKDSYVVLS